MLSQASGPKPKTARLAWSMASLASKLARVRVVGVLVLDMEGGE
jgi:hypothetical protein